MRTCTGLLGFLGLVGCGGKAPMEVLRSLRAEHPSCTAEELTRLTEALDGPPVPAMEWVEQLQRACPDLLSLSLQQALDQWAGAGARQEKAPAPSPLCQSLVASTPLTGDRAVVMARVYEDCEIYADGLYDQPGFSESSGPFGGLLASRLYAELLEAAVPASRAVAISKMVAGSPSRTIRSVYGDHSSIVWRVPLFSADAPRVEVPGCAPTIVVEGSMIWWHDHEWMPVVEGRPERLVLRDEGPPFLESGSEITAWQASRPRCEGEGKTALLAAAPEHAMELLRPLLWTLDGLDGYRPAILVRVEASDVPLTEVSPVGALEFRMIDVQGHEEGEMDSLFLLPAVASSWPELGDVESRSPRGSGWTPGLRLVLSEQGWQLYAHGELASEGASEPLVALSSVLGSHPDQVRREGIVLTLADSMTGAQLVALLEELQSYTDVVMLDARAPRKSLAPD